MHVNLGGYHVRDVEFVAAFDIDEEKVGKDLSEAIFSGQNNTIKFSDVPHLGVPVNRGMTHDGLGKYLSEVIEKAPGSTADIVGILKDVEGRRPRLVPARRLRGRDQVVRRAGPRGRRGLRELHPGVHRPRGVLAAPVLEKGLPIIGDDIKSQVGATILHRNLARLFDDRGVKIERTYQLNVGGNTDFMNMLERSRLESKKISKTNAVTSQIDYDLGSGNVHIGPSDHVPWLTDRKWAYIRVEGRSFGDVPLMAEVKLEVWDSPNSAGIVIDAVRLIKLALDNGISGSLEWPSAYLMKSPPHQHRDEQAREAVEEFIRTNARTSASTPAPAPAAGD